MAAQSRPKDWKSKIAYNEFCAARNAKANGSMQLIQVDPAILSLTK